MRGACGAGAAGGCSQRAGNNGHGGSEGTSACAKTGKRGWCVADPPGAASACFGVCPDVFFHVITMSPQERQRLEKSQGFCLEKRAEEGLSHAQLNCRKWDNSWLDV